MEPTRYNTWGTAAVPVPPGVIVGWGARAIDRGSRGWDILHDRQGFFGEMSEDEEVRRATSVELNGGILGQAQESYKAQEGYSLGSYELFDLYEDNKWVLKGRKSGGYVHIACWMKEGTREAMVARVEPLRTWLQAHAHLEEESGYGEQRQRYSHLKSELEWLEKELGL